MSHKHLTIEEREVIAEMIFAGYKKVEIAKELNRSPSTFGRELKRNQDSRKKYAASKADRKSKRRRKEGKLPWRLEYGPLKEFVVDKLKEKWSPHRMSLSVLLYRAPNTSSIDGLSPKPSLQETLSSIFHARFES